MCGRTGVDLIAALCAPRDDEFLRRAAAIVARTDVACSELLAADEWLYGPVHNHHGWIILHAIDATSARQNPTD